MTAKGTREAAKTTVKGGPEPRPTETGTALAATQPANDRNEAHVRHTGAGKTKLVEELLAATGAITLIGTITDGTTV
ncbi:elongation factor G-like protein EF-G2, partial [Paenarthrobacter ureafaciens]